MMYYEYVPFGHPPRSIYRAKSLEPGDVLVVNPMLKTIIACTLILQATGSYYRVQVLGKGDTLESRLLPINDMWVF